MYIKKNNYIHIINYKFVIWKIVRIQVVCVNNILLYPIYRQMLFSWQNTTLTWRPPNFFENSICWVLWMIFLKMLSPKSHFGSNFIDKLNIEYNWIVGNHNTEFLTTTVYTRIHIYRQTFMSALSTVHIRSERGNNWIRRSRDLYVPNPNCVNSWHYPPTLNDHCIPYS